MATGELWVLAKSLGLGLVVGILFTLLKLPIPAPRDLASIFGIIGLFSGMIIIIYLRNHFFSSHSSTTTSTPSGNKSFTPGGAGSAKKGTTIVTTLSS